MNVTIRNIGTGRQTIYTQSELKKTALHVARLHGVKLVGFQIEVTEFASGNIVRLRADCRNGDGSIVALSEAI